VCILELKEPGSSTAYSVNRFAAFSTRPVPAADFNLSPGPAVMTPLSGASAMIGSDQPFHAKTDAATSAKRLCLASRPCHFSARSRTFRRANKRTQFATFFLKYLVFCATSFSPIGNSRRDQTVLHPVLILNVSQFELQGVFAICFLEEENRDLSSKLIPKVLLISPKLMLVYD